jgi:hypothetical protein
LRIHAAGHSTGTGATSAAHTAHHLLQSLRIHTTWHSSGTGTSAAHTWHAWHTTSTLSIKDTWWSLISEVICSTCLLVKQGIALYFKAILSILHHWSQHLAEWG